MASQSRTSSTARKVTDCKGSRARVSCVRFPVNTRLYRRKRTFILNYLAHIYLASYSDDAMLGALMGDFVKPHAGLDFPAETEAEIITHRKIDCFTDSHPIVLEAKRLFATRSRRYAGILLDVFYDHLLALLSKSSEGRADAVCNQFYNTGTVTGVPSRVKRLSTAARICNSAT